MKHLAIILAAAAVLSTAAAQDAKTPPKAGENEVTVRVVGLSLAKPKANDKYGRSMAAMLSPGTSVYLAVTHKGKFFIELDKRAGKISSLTDNKKTDLLKTKRRGWGFGPIGSAEIIEDGHTCVFRVQGQGLPASGATQLLLKGSVEIICGADEKSAQQKDVALQKGGKITVGPVEWTIEDVKKTGKWDKENKIVVSLKATTTKDNLAKFKGIAFFGPDGEEIRSQPKGYMTSGWGGKVKTTREFGLAKNVKTVTVKVTWFDKTEKLKVPIDVKTGLGLGG